VAEKRLAVGIWALVQRLRTPGLPPRQILLDAPLVVRASTERETAESV